MKKFKNNSGFTLIEIIVVLIIVGVLAAIALPNLFSNVKKSRAAEATAGMSSLRAVIEACIAKNAGSSSTSCTSALVFGSTGINASPNFTYTYTPPATATGTDYTITASGTGALTTTDTITVSRANGATTVTCVGAGSLLGAC